MGEKMKEFPSFNVTFGDALSLSRSRKLCHRIYLQIPAHHDLLALSPNHTHSENKTTIYQKIPYTRRWGRGEWSRLAFLHCEGELGSAMWGWRRRRRQRANLARNVVVAITWRWISLPSPATHVVSAGASASASRIGTHFGREHNVPK